MKKTAKFCKYCGNEIDSATKKCSGCGKQYFKLAKNTFFIISTVILAIAVIVMSCVIYTNNKTIALYQDRIGQWQEANEKLTEYCHVYKQREKMKQDKIDSLTNEGYDLAQMVYDITMELNSYHSLVAIFTETGEKYHKASCSHVRNRMVIVAPVEWAKDNGLEPCKDCY